MQSFNANAFGSFKYFHRRRSSSSAVRLRHVSMLDYISLYLNNFVIDENLHRYTGTYISYITGNLNWFQLQNANLDETLNE